MPRAPKNEKKTAKKKVASDRGRSVAKKKAATKKASPRVPARTSAGLATPTGRPGDALALRLTEEILELDQLGKKRVAKNVVAIGDRLAALQHHLGFGAWLPWLVDRLPYSPRTAQRYIALARWAHTFADDFEHFAHLGIGKLQLLATLSPSERAELRGGGALRIPGVARRKTLEVMTHEELAAMLLGPQQLGAAPPAVPAAKILQRFRHRVAGLDAIADQLRARAADLDPDDIREVYDEMLAVAQELEEAFGL